MKQRRTAAEALDAAADGREFASVLLGMFAAADRLESESGAITDDPEDAA